MKVPGKACMKYLRRTAGSRRDSVGEKHLREYLVSHSGLDKKTAKKALAHAINNGLLDRKIPRRRDRFEETLREFFLWFYGGNEKLARQTLAEIKNRGLGELQLFILCDDLRDFLRTKRRRSAKKNWQKALRSKNQKADRALEDKIRQYSQESKKANVALGFR
jgi:hypothetical protein